MEQVDVDGSAKVAVPVEEAANRLGIGRTLAYELVRQGRIPSIQLGRRLVIPLAGLDALVETAIAEVFESQVEAGASR